MKITKLLTTFAALTTLMLSGCGKKDNEPDDKGKEDKPTPGHVHSWSDAWSSDNEYHWHTCSGCDEIKDYTKHSHDVIGNCTVCGRWCGLEISLHEKVEFENIAKDSKHFFRFELSNPVGLKRVKTGEFSADDFKIYRINNAGQPELVDIDGMSYKIPEASKTNYYYVVVSPVGSGVAEGSFTIEDNHTDLANLDVLGFCNNSGQYLGIDITSTNHETHFDEGKINFVGEFGAFFRFLPLEGKGYYLQLKNQLSHDLASFDTYARVGSEAVGLVPIDYYDQTYHSTYTAEDYYTPVTNVMGDGYVYVHWILNGSTGEEFTAEDYFSVMEVNQE